MVEVHLSTDKAAWHGLGWRPRACTARPSYSARAQAHPGPRTGSSRSGTPGAAVSPGTARTADSDAASRCDHDCAALARPGIRLLRQIWRPCRPGGPRNVACGDQLASLEETPREQWEANTGGLLRSDTLYHPTPCLSLSSACLLKVFDLEYKVLYTIRFCFYTSVNTRLHFLIPFPHK